MSVETTWLWIRHGPTNRTELNGWTDVPADLSDTETLNWLRCSVPLDAIVVSSDLCRASATADAITGTRRRLPDTPDLREICFGDWEGKTADQISATHPVESKRFWEDPNSTAPPNGESWAAVTDRVSTCVDQLNLEFASQTIVAVAHFGTILTQVGRASNANFSLTDQHVRNLSLTRLTHKSGTWTLHQFSEVPHQQKNRDLNPPPASTVCNSQH